MILISKTIIRTVAVAVLALASGNLLAAQDPAQLNDLEIAHVAYTADNIDIRYAHLALGISDSPAIREFAMTMIRDHSAVNEQALALLAKLDVAPQDNFLSQALVRGSRDLVDEMSQLRGIEFDRRYAANELAYHKAVNDLVANAFIPNIENGEVKALFEAGLKIFKIHEGHAASMVEQLR
jgi:putative membrane protein